MQICRKKYIMDKKIKNIDLKKIKVEILSLRKNLLNLKFQKSTGQLEKTAEIKKTRIKIARLKTDINKMLGEKNA